jgi:hypothetical protein
MGAIRKPQAVPLFLSVIAAAALISLAMLYRQAGIGQDAIVGLFGSVIGTAGAVLGALYVERSKRRDDRSRDQSVLRTSLVRLRDTLAALGQEPVRLGTPQENYDLERDLIGELRHAMMETQALLDAAAYGTRSGDAQLILDLHRVKRVIDYRLPILTEEINKTKPRLDRLDRKAVELLTIGADASESLSPFVGAAIHTIDNKPQN